MAKILVRCTIEVPVEVPDVPEYDAQFDIEENHCPGTGIVGSAIDAIIAHQDRNSCCWACTLGGKNEIVEKLPDDFKIFYKEKLWLN